MLAKINHIQKELDDIKCHFYMNEANIKCGSIYNVSVGAKVLIEWDNFNNAESIFPNDIYTILDKDNSIRPYKITSGIGIIDNWICPTSCKTFQPIIQGNFDARLIPEDKIPGYKVWDDYYKKWREVSAVVYDDTVIRISFNNEARCGFPHQGTWFDTQQLYFQPPEKSKVKPHNYTVGDCFSRYDGALYRLSISSNLYYAIFVNLRLKGKTFNKFHPVNEVLTIMDQVEFVDYLNDNDLIYKGPFEKVYSLNTSKED
jgi:hypothetical protein